MQLRLQLVVSQSSDPHFAKEGSRSGLAAGMPAGLLLGFAPIPQQHFVLAEGTSGEDVCERFPNDAASGDVVKAVGVPFYSALGA